MHSFTTIQDNKCTVTTIQDKKCTQCAFVVLNCNNRFSNCTSPVSLTTDMTLNTNNVNEWQIAFYFNLCTEEDNFFVSFCYTEPSRIGVLYSLCTITYFKPFFLTIIGALSLLKVKIWSHALFTLFQDSNWVQMYFQFSFFVTWEKMEHFVLGTLCLLFYISVLHSVSNVWSSHTKNLIKLTKRHFY